MSEELLKQIEELKSENEKLSRRNKLLQKKLTRIRKQGESSENEIVDLKEYTKLDKPLGYLIEGRCPKCRAITEKIILPVGVLTVCTVCSHRLFTK